MLRNWRLDVLAHLARFFAKAEFKEVHRVPARRFRCLTKVWSRKGLCRGEGYDTTACWVKADKSRVRIDGKI